VGDLGERQPFRRFEPEEGVAFLNRLAAALTTEKVKDWDVTATNSWASADLVSLITE